MPFETHPPEQDPDAPSQSWFARLIAFIAWLFGAEHKLKRIRHTTKFKPDWRDRYAELLPVEWHRDQMLAQGAALLLAGKTLDDAGYQPIPMPPNYGGTCPKTPFEIARRWLAVTKFLKDPEAHIIRHTQRIAKREGRDLSKDPLRLVASRRSTSPTCVPSGGGKRRRLLPPPVATRLGGGGMRASCAHDGGGRSSARARAPPPHTLLPTAHSRLPQTLRV